MKLREDYPDPDCLKTVLIERERRQTFVIKLTVLVGTVVCAK